MSDDKDGDAGERLHCRFCFARHAASQGLFSASLRLIPLLEYSPSFLFASVDPLICRLLFVSYDRREHVYVRGIQAGWRTLVRVASAS